MSFELNAIFAIATCTKAGGAGTKGAVTFADSLNAWEYRRHLPPER